MTVQSRASRPVGEGDLFLTESMRAGDLIAAADTLNSGVRQARNELEVEAVSVIGPDGRILESTSPNLSGSVVANPLLMAGIATHQLFALATATEQPVMVDGVTEWDEGSILYQVVSPLSGGDLSVLTYYDISQLFERRVRPSGIQPETLQILGIGAIFALLGLAVLITHNRVSRRHREMALESELLRVHSKELATANEELAQARTEAERALALAEEKIRIRSEFVLMINHELRTPLTSVVTGAQLLRSGELDPADRDQVFDAMIADGMRLQEMIDMILAVARLENRGLAPMLQDLPMGAVCSLVKAAHPRTMPMVDAFHAETIIHTDAKTLSMVVASLADNARTHGATDVHIGCASRSSDEIAFEIGQRPESAAFITVTDNGPGIDVDFLPRIFEKFEKSSRSSGTGIGLYMTRLMVEAMDASIGVSTSSSGTTFQIALPAMVGAQTVAAR